MCRHTEQAVHKPGREGAAGETTLLTPWPWPLASRAVRNQCRCLRHTVCGMLLWQPQLTNGVILGVFNLDSGKVKAGLGLSLVKKWLEEAGGSVIVFVVVVSLSFIPPWSQSLIVFMFCESLLGNIMVHLTATSCGTVFHLFIGIFRDNFYLMIQKWQRLSIIYYVESRFRCLFYKIWGVASLFQCLFLRPCQSMPYSSGLIWLSPT